MKRARSMKDSSVLTERNILYELAIFVQISVAARQNPRNPLFFASKLSRHRALFLRMVYCYLNQTAMPENRSGNFVSSNFRLWGKGGSLRYQAKLFLNFK